MKEALVIAGYPVEVIRQRNYKRLILKVKPPQGHIVISGPVYANNAAIESFFNSHLDQIQKLQADIVDRYQDQVKHYETGEMHELWGETYPLRVQETTGKSEAYLQDNQLVLNIKKGAGLEERQKAMQDFYRQALKAQLMKTSEDMQRQMGVYANEFRVKAMKTRWGTCNIQKRRIWINLTLAKAPLFCLELVVVHELVHLLETNHTKRFYGLMDEYFSKWQEANAVLSKYASIMH